MKITAFVKLLAEAAGQIPERNLPGSIARFSGITDDGRCSGLQCEFHVSPEGDVLPKQAEGASVLVTIKRGVSAS